jgi:BON domain
MGIFDFAQKAQAKIAADQEAKMTELLKGKLNEYGLVVKDVHVGFDAGVVTVEGEAANRSTKEKVVLALGNLPGVHKVDEAIP